MERLVDLSPTVPHGFRGPPSTDVGVELAVRVKAAGGAFWQSAQASMSTHTGTHVESARHVIEDGETIDEVALERNGVAAAAGDVALVRTGYLAGWPDPERLAAHRGAGPDISAARLLVERGVVAAGSDTETFEVQPARDRGEPANPQPVHTLLLIEQGIYIVESLDLEQLAAAGIREFLFVALPLAIRGATGSMIDPVAVV